MRDEIMQPYLQSNSAKKQWPACVSVEDAAAIFGWPVYYMPFLVRSGHLKPLGKPAQNGRKWFATVELAQHSQDRDWLDKAVRIVAKRIREMNEKQRTKFYEVAKEIPEPVQK